MQEAAQAERHPGAPTEPASENDLPAAGSRQPQAGRREQRPETVRRGASSEDCQAAGWPSWELCNLQTLGVHILHCDIALHWIGCPQEQQVLQAVSHSSRGLFEKNSTLHRQLAWSARAGVNSSSLLCEARVNRAGGRFLQNILWCAVRAKVHAQPRGDCAASQTVHAPHHSQRGEP